MAPERWQQVERVYHAAAARPAEERAPFFDQECDGDVELRGEVERMLGAESGAGGFLDSPAMELAARWMAAANVVTPGSRLGPYEIVTLLGKGGMGEVYKARDTRLDRTVAIKLLHNCGDGDGESRRRLLREARAASTLNHPHIVTLHDILSEGGRDALVMEYLAGATLEKTLQLKTAEGLPLRETLHYAIQIADALAAAHAAGIVHRDVKPSNIVLAGETSGFRSAKVLDFGLAKFSAVERAGERTETGRGDGRIAGTVAYMSPEQAEGCKVDARSDIFSFGVVLYEMLTGRKAFDRETTQSTLTAILRDEVEPVPGIPESLRTVLGRCLRKDPAKRAQSMADIKVSLEEIREQGERALAWQRNQARYPWKWAAVIAGVAVLAAGSWMAVVRSGSIAAQVVVKPITSYPGTADSPSFSPDGNQVAFSWNGEQQDQTGIYVKLVDSGSPLRLTSKSLGSGWPAWSPDGRQIAFLRWASPVSWDLLLISPLGGVERKLANIRTSQAVTPAWTPDSKFLAVRDEGAIVLVSVETGEKRKLTSPPFSRAGDFDAAISPDGRTLAFWRSAAQPTGDIFLAPLSDGAKARKLTHDNRIIYGLAWDPDGKDIIFSSDRTGDITLWRIPASGGVPERLPAVGSDAVNPAVARQGRRVAFTRRTTRTSFWRLDLSPEGLRQPPARVAASSRLDRAPVLSPDGRRIAFVSDRSGAREVWVCDSDGANAVQLTSMGYADSPSWSPDSRNIAFNGRPGDSGSFVFVIGAGGGAARRLTGGGMPSWSRDGRSIYFFRSRPSTQVWKIPAEGGKAIQVTKGGGGFGIESLDGKYFYYYKGGELWKAAVGGGEETLVLKDGDKASIHLWTLGSQGFYSMHPGSRKHKTTLKLFSLESGQSSQIAAIDQPFPTWDTRLSLPADNSWLLYNQIDRSESDIMLVENVR